MTGKADRTVTRRGQGAAKGKGGQSGIVECVLKEGGGLTPLLVDSSQGAKMLCVSLSTFYKVMRKSESAPMLQLGTLQRWRRKDLLRFLGKAFRCTIAEDFLLDAKAVSILCSVSRPMFYKMHREGTAPPAVFNGRMLRWSCQEIVEWIEAGCPKRRKRKGKRK